MKITIEFKSLAELLYFQGLPIKDSAMPTYSKDPIPLTDREAFEKWATDNGKYPDNIKKNDAGSYVSTHARNMWTSWKAACKYRDEHE